MQDKILKLSLWKCFPNGFNILLNLLCLVMLSTKSILLWEAYYRDRQDAYPRFGISAVTMSQCCTGSPKPINPLCAFLETRHHPSVTGTNAEQRKSLWLNQAETQVSKIIFHSCETHTHILYSTHTYHYQGSSLHITACYPVPWYLLLWQRIATQFLVCQVMGWLLVFLAQIWFINDCKQKMESTKKTMFNILSLFPLISAFSYCSIWEI